MLIAKYQKPKSLEKFSYLLLRYHSMHYIQVYSGISRYTTAQKMKFSIKDFFSKCDQILRKHLIEILKGKFQFLCSDPSLYHPLHKLLITKQGL